MTGTMFMLVYFLIGPVIAAALAVLIARAVVREWQGR